MNLRFIMLLLVGTGCGRLGFGSGDDVPAIDALVCVAPAGHDEDSDGFDDACDVCPQLADDQRDTDRDGVGDACDFAPTTQQRTFFDTFTAARTQWMYGSQVAFLGDALSFPAIGDSIGIYWLETPGRAVFETGGHIGAAGATGNRQVAIHVGEPAGITEYFCELYDNGTQFKVGITYTLDDGVNYFGIASMLLGGRLENADVRIAFVHSPPDVSCVVTWDGVRYEIGGAAPAVVPMAMYMAANNVDAQFDYFVRLETP